MGARYSELVADKVEAFNNALTQIGERWYSYQLNVVVCGIQQGRNMAQQGAKMELYGDPDLCIIHRQLQQYSKEVKQVAFMFEEMGYTPERVCAILLQIIDGQLTNEDLGEMHSLYKTISKQRQFNNKGEIGITQMNHNELMFKNIVKKSINANVQTDRLLDSTSEDLAITNTVTTNQAMLEQHEQVKNSCVQYLRNKPPISSEPVTTVAIETNQLRKTPQTNNQKIHHGEATPVCH